MKVFHSWLIQFYFSSTLLKKKTYPIGTIPPSSTSNTGPELPKAPGTAQAGNLTVFLPLNTSGQQAIPVHPHYGDETVISVLQVKAKSHQSLTGFHLCSICIRKKCNALDHYFYTTQAISA